MAPFVFFLSFSWTTIVQDGRTDCAGEDRAFFFLLLLLNIFDDDDDATRKYVTRWENAGG